MVADEALNDRTHKVSIHGSVRAEYGNSSYDKLLFRNGSIDERRRLEVRVHVFKELHKDLSGNDLIDTVLGTQQQAIKYATDEVARANLAWAQSGIEIVMNGAVIFDPPPVVVGGGGPNLLDDDMLFLTDWRERSTIPKLWAGQATPDVLEVFYVGPMKVTSGLHHGLAILPALDAQGFYGNGDKTFVYLSSEGSNPTLGENLRPNPVERRTLAHEIGHALTNGFDQSDPIHTFFALSDGTKDDLIVNRRRRVTKGTGGHKGTTALAKTERTPGNLKGQGNLLLKKTT